MAITHQYTDDSRAEHIEVTLASEHVIFITIREDGLVKLHSSGLLAVSEAVNVVVVTPTENCTCTQDIRTGEIGSICSEHGSE